MTLRARTLLIVSSTVAIIGIVTLILTRAIILQNYRLVEEGQVRDNLLRTANALSDLINTTRVTATDYAVWDDMYAVVEDPDEDFFEGNLSDVAFERLGMNAAVVVDLEGNPVFARFYDMTSSEVVPTDDETLYAFLENPVLVLDSESQLSKGGLVVLPNRVMVVGVAPILPDDRVPPTRGTFIWARDFDSQQVAALSTTLSLDVDVYRIDTDSSDEEYLAARQNLLRGATEYIVPVSPETNAGYMLINDIVGNPAVIVRILLPRSTFLQGQATIRFFLLILGVTSFGLATASILLLERQVISRVAKLSAEVNRITAEGDPSQRVRVDGHDELASLAQNVNRMLESIDRTQQDLIVARNQAEEAARAKSEFLATMSHELRTPLNAVLGYSQLMLKGVGGTLSEKHHRNLERIFTNGEHLLGLINNVLDLSKIEAGRVEIVNQPFSLRPLINEIMGQMDSLAVQKELLFAATVDEALPDVIVGDAERIKQIIINLISNAIKFTKAGSVRVAIESGEDKSQYTISVRDTGIGIPSHALETIFDPFQQTPGISQEFGGTGLGLAIVRNLTRLMGGTVRVQSQVGEGTTFVVSLPLLLPEQAAQPFAPTRG